ncbi:hypothetical protein ONS95_004552 [Cadophora gregata]|uniref:uncharacterized protein n=1 Tax=Cadophora gregata TaxID=51156 RepID=UPI0026DC7724|nr:uncharacterized protein ONS95_004552 [Cadophora gregata]KAK0105085.1 hypothetical protein ONS96_004488 [Cadophora gregata f. sp. sojae]KAK0106046.1 hypothetical protein ONS95_004552 [Cadophora gregata]
MSYNLTQVRDRSAAGSGPKSISLSSATIETRLSGSTIRISVDPSIGSSGSRVFSVISSSLEGVFGDRIPRSTTFSQDGKVVITHHERRRHDLSRNFSESSWAAAGFQQNQPKERIERIDRARGSSSIHSIIKYRRYNSVTGERYAGLTEITTHTGLKAGSAIQRPTKVDTQVVAATQITQPHEHEDSGKLSIETRGEGLENETRGSRIVRLDAIPEEDHGLPVLLRSGPSSAAHSMPWSDSGSETRARARAKNSKLATTDTISTSLGSNIASRSEPRPRRHSL